MRSWFASLILAGFWVQPAAAMTGAEFLQADKQFASGYAWSALDSALFSVTDDEPLNRLRARQRECAANAKINGETLYDMVSAYIRSHHKAMPEPAFGAVYNALAEMCPLK